MKIGKHHDGYRHPHHRRNDDYDDDDDDEDDDNHHDAYPSINIPYASDQPAVTVKILGASPFQISAARSG